VIYLLYALQSSSAIPSSSSSSLLQGRGKNGRGSLGPFGGAGSTQERLQADRGDDDASCTSDRGPRSSSSILNPTVSIAIFQGPKGRGGVPRCDEGGVSKRASPRLGRAGDPPGARPRGPAPAYPRPR